MKLSNLYLAGFACILAMPMKPVLAQGALEEIVITSRRYEENLQDTPVSVNVMDAESVKENGLTRLDDALQLSPSVTYIRFNKLQDEYGMRGVNSQTEGASGDSSVQTVIDNVVISKDFMKNTPFFDVQRIEVLRGPQGTSFGRNASAGLVHIITNRPSQEFEAGLTIGAGNLGAFDIDGVISGALSDELSGRIAVHHDTIDGWWETPSGEDLGGQSNTSIRASLLWEPSDTFSAYLKIEHNDDDDDGSVRRSLDCTMPTLATQQPGPPGLHPAIPVPFASFPAYTDPCDPYVTEITNDIDFYLERQVVNISSELVWDLKNDLTLTSVTGYVDGESDYLIDALGTPAAILFQDTINDAKSFTQEIRIDNHGTGNQLRWLAGLYYLDDEHFRDDQNRFYDTNSAATPLDGRPLTLDTKISNGETQSFGIFGEITYDFTDNLNGTFGIRYSDDTKDFSIAHTALGFAPIVSGSVEDTLGTCVFPGPGGIGGCPLIGFGTPDSPAGNPQTPVPVSSSWDNISMKGSLSYNVNDDVLLYTSYSEGYKTGGFQPEPFNATAALIPFNEETSTSYEAGLKGEWAERFRLNVSLFFLEYEDLQVTQFLPAGAGFTSLISNAGGVESLGLEIEYLWHITDNFNISGSYAYLDTEFVNTILLSDNGMGVAAPTDLSGTRPDNSVEWTGSLAAEYNLDFDSGSSLSLRADWRSRGDAFDDVGENPDRVRPGVNIFGARGTWRSADSRWEVALWGKNLTDEAEILSLTPVQPNTFQLHAGYDAPRTFGITVGHTWD